MWVLPAPQLNTVPVDLGKEEQGTGRESTASYTSWLAEEVVQTCLALHLPWQALLI